jgi:hypothetical protein
MFRGVARVGAIVATAVLALAAPCVADADSLTLSIGARPTLGQPLSVVAAGSAETSSHLYVYVEAGGEACAVDPEKETTEVFGALALSSVTGDPLSAGAFSETYSYTPAANNVYSVCAYLDDDLPIATATAAAAAFAVPSGPVEAPYLRAILEEENRIAVEHEQQELQEQATQREAREALERIPASELPQPRQAPAAQVAPRPAVRCIVPSLAHRSLQAARTSLRRAHCALGRVARPRHAIGALVVRRQSAPRGATLRAGSAVAVVLGRAKH